MGSKRRVAERAPACEIGPEFFLRKRRLWPWPGTRRRRIATGRFHRTLPATSDMDGAVEELVERRKERIRVTLAREALYPVFQPIVQLRSGDTVGAEALTRFENDLGRPPDRWFDEAAALGLGVDLELLALRKALGHLRQLPSGMYLSLNASPATMVSPEFRAAFADVQADRVILELTEHESIGDYQAFEQAVDQLRATGLRLAVDDVGAGFASLLRVLNLRPEVIKIDIGLTRGIDIDPARRALGYALLRFGFSAYSSTIVAEGIETQGELDTLRALGCHCGQGFYLGRPGLLPAVHRLSDVSV